MGRALLWGICEREEPAFSCPNDWCVQGVGPTGIEWTGARDAKCSVVGRTVLPNEKISSPQCQ